MVSYSRFFLPSWVGHILPLREQRQKSQRIVRRVHDGGCPGGAGGMAHPAESGAGKRDEHHMTPGISVLREMQKAERNRRGQNAGDGSQTADQQRLQETAEDQLLAQRREGDSED